MRNKRFFYFSNVRPQLLSLLLLLLLLLLLSLPLLLAVLLFQLLLLCLVLLDDFLFEFDLCFHSQYLAPPAIFALFFLFVPVTHREEG